MLFLFNTAAKLHQDSSKQRKWNKGYGQTIELDRNDPSEKNDEFDIKKIPWKIWAGIPKTYEVFHSSVFRSSSIIYPFISKLSISVDVYKQIWIMQYKQYNMQWKKTDTLKKKTRYTKDYFCGGRIYLQWLSISKMELCLI